MQTLTESLPKLFKYFFVYNGPLDSSVTLNQLYSYAVGEVFTFLIRTPLCQASGSGLSSGQY